MNNVFIFDDAPTQGTDRYFSDQSDQGGSLASVTVIAGSRHNVWPPDSNPAVDRFTLWLNPSENMTLAEWQVLGVCEDENAEACTSADFDPGGAYLPDVSLTVVWGAGAPTPGVHRDYRGVPRNPNATTWIAGCTSDDS